ncbi:MAG: efflux RND transporter permease subunit, partial [Muribaculaceae bacterium]|nr:efflux RND transporter permease subunit [Muribaculaceae bacterium]
MKHFSIIVVFIALSIAGCALLPLLPVKLAPSQTLPSITVSFSMKGASSRTVEQEVTSRIESILARINGVKGIDSKSRDGGGRVTVSLDRHADMDNVRFEVSTLVRQVWGQLPEGVSYPFISLRQADSDASRPFITLTLNAPANPSEIMTYGEENLKPLLSRIKGVGSVELSGAQPMEWKLHYDIDRLSAHGMTPSDIRNAINEHYKSEFLGIAPIVRENGMEWLRISMSSVSDRESFNPADISLTAKDGNIISLDKITETTHEEAEPTGYFRINGLNSIYVNIIADEYANQLNVAKEIRESLSEFIRHMPQGFMIDTAYDATDEIHKELDKIYFRTGLTII